MLSAGSEPMGCVQGNPPKGTAWSKLPEVVPTRRDKIGARSAVGVTFDGKIHPIPVQTHVLALSSEHRNKRQSAAYAVRPRVNSLVLFYWPMHNLLKPYPDVWGDSLLATFSNLFMAQ